MKYARWTFALLAALTAVSAYAEGVIDNNVIAYWAFDEGEGDSAEDSSQFDSDGEIEKGEWTAGISGTALLFNGSDARVVVQNNDNLHPDTGDITIEAWIRADSSPDKWTGAGAIVFKGGAYQWVVHGANKGALWFGIWGARLESTNNYHFIDHVGEWRHTALTFEGDSREAKIYVDGELNTEGVVNEAVDPTANVLYIGFKGDGSGYFHGAIDEVRISDVVRTQNEIQDQMNTTLSVEPAGKLPLQWGRLKRQ